MFQENQRITMAHGSGGRSSHELMEGIFGKYFHNDILDLLEDAAVLPPAQYAVPGVPTSAEGKQEAPTLAVSTDSFVITPLFFPGGNIGKLCVCGTVNDLLMMGAQPRFLTCGFIIEEGMLLSDLDVIAASLAKAAEEAGVKVIAGDTKVVEGQGGIYINTTGIGVIPPGRDARAANLKPGDKVIVSGTLGDHQACIYSQRMGIQNDIQSDCGCLRDITEGLQQGGIQPHTMRDVTRGGLGTILNELADASGCQVLLEEEAIPVRPSVKGLTSILGLDPLYMANEGKMIVVVAEEDAAKALEILHGTEHGQEAAIIGTVLEGKGVEMRTPLGGRRVVDVLYGEGLPRIC